MDGVSQKVCCKRVSHVRTSLGVFEPVQQDSENTVWRWYDTTVGGWMDG